MCERVLALSERAVEKIGSETAKKTKISHRGPPGTEQPGFLWRTGSAEVEETERVLEPLHQMRLRAAAAEEATRESV